MRMLLCFLTLSPLLQATGEKLEIHKGYPLVQAHINGQGPFRLLLDTGSTTSYVTTQIADRLRLDYTHRTVVVTAAGEQIIPATASTHIRVGTTESAGVELLAAPLPGLRHLGLNVDGILGQNFLSRHPYLLDFRAKRILFHDEATEKAQSMPATFLGPAVAGRPVLNVQLDPVSAPVVLVLDSGASGLLLYCTSRCPRLTDPSAAALEAVTNNGARRVRHGILPQATLGELQFKQRRAAIIHANPEPGQADGLLPANWFSAIYYDAARQEIRLAP
ncbi:MAG: aspartyl protease family protein [Acidobacteria bacterium]|nr:aspartyl protease family protein [Acidobacteriota bacterium]